MLSAINISHNKINFTTYRLINESDFAVEDSRTRIQSDDVLLTIVGAIGRTAVVPLGLKPFTLQRSVAVLTPAQIDSKFLMYQLESSRISTFFNKSARGTAQKGIYLKTLASTEIWFPSLNEQKRIVAKIEELFSELDKGIESLKTARSQLKIYRQAVLKHAFEGKLTAQWREEHKDKLESPEQLLARIQQEREACYQQQLTDWQAALKTWEQNGKDGKKPGKPKVSKEQLIPFYDEDLRPLPFGWDWIGLSAVSENIQIGPFGSLLHKSDYVSGGIPLINPSHIKEQKIISNEDFTVSINKLKDLKKYVMREHDIVIGRRGEMGRCAVITKNESGWLCGTGSLFVRLLDSMNPFFYSLVLSSHRVKDYLSESSIGTTMQNLNEKILHGVPIPLCSRYEQDQVISMIERQNSVLDDLQKSINSELKKAESLRQSILKKAFSGQLVPQDPNDEPAAVLCDRIRAAKAAQPQSSKKTRGKRQPSGKESSP